MLKLPTLPLSELKPKAEKQSLKLSLVTHIVLEMA